MESNKYPVQLFLVIELLKAQEDRLIFYIKVNKSKRNYRKQFQNIKKSIEHVYKNLNINS